MREAARVYSEETEVDVLRRYIHLRAQMDLPRVYQHAARPQFYRLGDKWYGLQALSRHVQHLEQQARRLGKAVA